MMSLSDETRHIQDARDKMEMLYQQIVLSVIQSHLDHQFRDKPDPEPWGDIIHSLYITTAIGEDDVPVENILDTFTHSVQDEELSETMRLELMFSDGDPAVWDTVRDICETIRTIPKERTRVLEEFRKFKEWADN